MEGGLERLTLASHWNDALQGSVLTPAWHQVACRVQHREHRSADNPFAHQVRSFRGYDVALQHRELILVLADRARCYRVKTGNRLNANKVWLRKRDLPLSRFLESLGYCGFNDPCRLVGVRQGCQLPLQVREEFLIEFGPAGLGGRTQRLRTRRFNSTASTITSSSSAIGAASRVRLGWLASGAPYSVAKCRSNSTADGDDG